MKAETVIRLREVSKVYSTEEIETHALSNIHLDVLRGEFLAISGPSGCGKSTLLGLLGLLDSPTSGELLFSGREVHGLGQSDRALLRNKVVGFVFQSFNLIADLTVEENVELPLVYARMPAAKRRQRAVEALDQVGMSGRLAHYPAQLSGGQQQRVAVARAIVHRPEVLLADEPTGNLDSNNAEEVMGLLEELHSAGGTVCLVTHDDRWARAAERTIHLFDGKMVDESAAGGAA